RRRARLLPGARAGRRGSRGRRGVGVQARLGPRARLRVGERGLPELNEKGPAGAGPRPPGNGPAQLFAAAVAEMPIDAIAALAFATVSMTFPAFAASEASPQVFWMSARLALAASSLAASMSLGSFFMAAYESTFVLSASTIAGSEAERAVHVFVSSSFLAA